MLVVLTILRLDRWSTLFFKYRILKYQIDNQLEKDYICNKCHKKGIFNIEMNWSEKDKNKSIINISRLKNNQGIGIYLFFMYNK